MVKNELPHLAWNLLFSSLLGLLRKGGGGAINLLMHLPGLRGWVASVYTVVPLLVMATCLNHLGNFKSTPMAGLGQISGSGSTRAGLGTNMLLKPPDAPHSAEVGLC